MKNVFVVALVVAALAAGSLLAQPMPPSPLANPTAAAPAGPPGPGGPPPAGPPPDLILKNVLGFTDEQLTSLKALLDTRQQALATLGPQIADAEKALADALGAANPDPAQLGTLLLKVKALRDQVTAANEAFTTAVKALLTTAQQQKVSDILNLEKSLSAVPVLHGLGL